MKNSHGKQYESMKTNKENVDDKQNVMAVDDHCIDALATWGRGMRLSHEMHHANCVDARRYKKKFLSRKDGVQRKKGELSCARRGKVALHCDGRRKRKRSWNNLGKGKLK